jgi:hypothetical protein
LATKLIQIIPEIKSTEILEIAQMKLAMEINQDFRFDKKCFKIIDSEHGLN